jgi:hypothetical protein
MSSYSNTGTRHSISQDPGALSPGYKVRDRYYMLTRGSSSSQMRITKLRRIAPLSAISARCSGVVPGEESARVQAKCWSWEFMKLLTN